MASRPSTAIGLILALAVDGTVASGLYFGFAEWPPGMRAVAPLFVLVSALEIGAHLVVAGALWARRSWGRLAALVLAGVNLVVLVPPTAMALLVGGSSPNAFGPYWSDIALAATTVLAIAAVAGNVALVIVVARFPARAA